VHCVDGEGWGKGKFGPKAEWAWLRLIIGGCWSLQSMVIVSYTWYSRGEEWRWSRRVIYSVMTSHDTKCLQDIKRLNEVTRRAGDDRQLEAPRLLAAMLLSPTTEPPSPAKHPDLPRLQQSHSSVPKSTASVPISIMNTSPASPHLMCLGMRSPSVLHFWSSVIRGGTTGRSIDNAFPVSGSTILSARCGLDVWGG
jgi:hypothetical protein